MRTTKSQPAVTRFSAAVALCSGVLVLGATVLNRRLLVIAIAYTRFATGRLGAGGIALAIAIICVRIAVNHLWRCYGC